MTKSTGMHRKDDNDRSEPWRSWPSTVRYMVVKLAQAAITALPDGSSEIVVASTNEPPAMGIRYSTGSWDTNWTQLYESPAYVSASGASIAGMPNGDTQVIEVAQSAS